MQYAAVRLPGRPFIFCGKIFLVDLLAKKIINVSPKGKCETFFYVIK